MKKICFILSGLGGGGIESLVTTLSNYYVYRGHTVSLMLLYNNEPRFFTPDSRISIYEPVLQRNGTNRFFYALKLIKYIRRTIKEIKPEVIVSHGEWHNSYIILACLGLGVPVFIEDHMNPDLNLGWLLNNAKKLLYKRATGIIALTNYAAQIIKERTGSTNIQVIPNPINLKEALPCIKKNIIITVGRLSKEKGHIFLLEAFSKLHTSDWYLDIVGDGPERKTLELRSVSLGISNNVKFHGYLKDFTHLLSQSQIFVLPSLSECFPLSLTEAMSLPMACISSDCLAGSDVIIKDNENGLLVPPGNSDKLSVALKSLIDDINLRERLSKNAYKIRKELNIDDIASKYLNFITNNKTN